MFARSTASITAGEHAAQRQHDARPGRHPPDEQGERQEHRGDQDQATARRCATGRVRDTPRRSQGRRYISGRRHGSHGFSYSGS